jgi:hypothetical protein
MFATYSPSDEPCWPFATTGLISYAVRCWESLNTANVARRHVSLRNQVARHLGAGRCRLTLQSFTAEAATNPIGISSPREQHWTSPRGF